MIRPTAGAPLQAARAGGHDSGPHSLPFDLSPSGEGSRGFALVHAPASWKEPLTE